MADLDPRSCHLSCKVCWDRCNMPLPCARIAAKEENERRSENVAREVGIIMSLALKLRSCNYYEYQTVYDELKKATTVLVERANKK